MKSDYSSYLSRKNIAGLLFGSLLLALGINLFIAPHDLAFGGVTGICIIVHRLTLIPLSLLNLLFSIAIMLIGKKFLGTVFLIKTIIPSLAIPLWLELTALIPIPIQSIGVSVLLGSLLMGTGVSLVMGFGGSTAGPDTIAMILKEKRNIPPVPVMRAIDVLIIILGVFIFGLETAAFSICVVIITSVTVKSSFEMTGRWLNNTK